MKDLRPDREIEMGGDSIVDSGYRSYS